MEGSGKPLDALLLAALAERIALANLRMLHACTRSESTLQSPGHFDMSILYVQGITEQLHCSITAYQYYYVQNSARFTAVRGSARLTRAASPGMHRRLGRHIVSLA